MPHSFMKKISHLHINLQRFVKRLTIYPDKAQGETTSDDTESLQEKYNTSISYTVQFKFHENKNESVIQNIKRTDFGNYCH